jgi:hypothetical protein
VRKGNSTHGFLIPLETKDADNHHQQLSLATVFSTSTNSFHHKFNDQRLSESLDARLPLEGLPFVALHIILVYKTTTSETEKSQTKMRLKLRPGKNGKLFANEN